MSERNGQRETMDKMVKYLRTHNPNMPASEAKKIARDCAIRDDRRKDEKKG